MPRYRFHDFTLSTRTRILMRSGEPQPLIPRYFDLLVFLIERRQEAVHRRDIFDRVWSDVIVSDSALSQAIRTLRRTLGDDPREPRFIRTVSRHGYQFTCPDIVEEPDEEAATPVVVAPPAEPTGQKVGASLAATLTGARRGATGAALTGAANGFAGGLLLSIAPGSAPLAVVPVLTLVGAAAGAVGGLGVGAGLAAAESSSRLRNIVGVTAGGAIGGAAIGLIVQWLMRWSLATLVGVNMPVGGALEGLVLGAAAGAGYVLARRAVPATWSDLHKAAIVVVLCAVGAALLSGAGRPLVGGTLHLIAREARGSQMSLAPLGGLVGEPDFGPLSQALIAAWEGGFFGLGLGLALLRRQADRRD